MTLPYWHYRARFVRAVDGDTVEAVIDAGFGMFTTKRLRVLGVDTPELRGGTPETKAAARAAALFVEEWMAAVEYRDDLNDPDWPLVVRTERPDNFGRYLADIMPNVSGASSGLSDDLISAGMGVEYVPR